MAVAVDPDGDRVVIVDLVVDGLLQLGDAFE